MSNIFSPLQVKGVHFTNRIVMAPMVRFGFSCKNGIMGEKLLQEYLERADKDIGLMISQVLCVSPDAKTAGGAGAYSEDHIGYLHKMAEAGHRNGSCFFAQLGMPGYAFYDNFMKDVNSLTTQDLIKIRDKFIHAAEICKKAGLDGIEMHGAHTFFLNMMSSVCSNRRQDIYGGDLFGRLTLAKEIIEGIKSFAGDNFIVSYRMGWCDSLDTDVQTAQVLEKIGIDMLHVSTGIPEDRKLELPQSFEYNDVVYTGCHVKKHVGVPIIVVNDIKTLGRGNKLIENGCCDFAAYGKPFLADGAFVKHSIGNMDYKPCFECGNCQWFTNGEKCPARLLPKRQATKAAESER